MLRSPHPGLLLFAVVVGGCSCGDDGLTLHVDVRTDFAPGLEFAQVRAELSRGEEGSAGARMTQTAVIDATIGQDFIAGQRVAEFGLGSAGTYVVDASLLRADGSIVVTRRARMRVDESFGVTILLTRSCEGVRCPDPGGDPEATTCLAGRCVPPDCVVGSTDEACGELECDTDTECTTLVDCAEGRCIERACLQVPRAGGCAPGEWCSVERGCVELPGDSGPVCVPEAEACNAADDDCDGTTDEGFALDSDPANCGSCGNVCGDAHATASCTSGACTLTCDEGWADCDGSPGTGCESDLASSGSCGSCSTVCADPTPLCVGAAGSFSCESSCPPASPTLCGSSCVDTSSSLAHCGGCGVACDPPRATGECRSGSCAVATCDAGWADCNGDPADGCEADLSAATSCGACGTSCDGAAPYCARAGASWACTDGCGDGVRGGAETDVDCGGPLCAPCEIGEMCMADPDCGTALRCSGGVCIACGVCAPGAMDSMACGMCGMRSRTCDGTCNWGAYGSCTGEGACSAGANESRACGNCGTQSRSCDGSCSWSAYGTCIGEGVCSAGTVDTQSCGMCGSRSRTCSSSCSWGSFGGCTGEGVCSPGAMETQSCGNCGTRSRTCSSSCAWGSWSGCSGEGVCSPGAMSSTSCGNCGTQTRTCQSSCTWGSYGTCTGEGECAPGSRTSAGCYNTCQQRTCNSSCSFPAAPDACTACSCSSVPTVCGFSCPASYHVTSRNFSSSCGSCCSDNAVSCAPNCGSSFTQCSVGSCPTGYHPTAYSFNSSCGSCCSNNSTRCELNAGSSFTSCGFSCPSGYVVTSMSFNSSCGSCCSNNSVRCSRL